MGESNRKRVIDCKKREYGWSDREREKEEYKGWDERWEKERREER